MFTGLIKGMNADDLLLLVDETMRSGKMFIGTPLLVKYASLVKKRCLGCSRGWEAGLPENT